MFFRPPRFHNRREAGRALARRLRAYEGRTDAIVLGLPRGGVPVAAEVAAALRLPLDVFIVRKLGVPGCEELAMGALASGGVCVLNENVMERLADAQAALARAIEGESREIARRDIEYRGDRQPPDLWGKTVLLVDDGLATGATMRAALRALRQRGIARCVAAAPVAAPDVCDRLREEADDFVCLNAPANFQAVGQFYDDFSQTTDDEVRACLERAA